jgi:uncharacterized membrane protein
VFLSFLKAGVFYLFLLTIFAIFFLLADLCHLSDLVSSVTATCDEQGLSSTLVRALFLGSLVAAIIFFIVFRKMKNSWHRRIASRSLSEDNYTILISNIPVLDFPRPGESKKNSEFLYRKHLEQYL